MPCLFYMKRNTSFRIFNVSGMLVLPRIGLGLPFRATGLIILVLATLGRLSRGQDAERCDPSYCRLPNCFCGGSKIPGGLKAENTPQFVLLTFDDAVNGLNREFFTKLFSKRVNPNGCSIKVHRSLWKILTLIDVEYFSDSGC